MNCMTRWSHHLKSWDSSGSKDGIFFKQITSLLITNGIPCTVGRVELLTLDPFRQFTILVWDLWCYWCRQLILFSWLSIIFWYEDVILPVHYGGVSLSVWDVVVIAWSFPTVFNLSLCYLNFLRKCFANDITYIYIYIYIYMHMLLQT